MGDVVIVGDVFGDGPLCIGWGSDGGFCRCWWCGVWGIGVAGCVLCGVWGMGVVWSGSVVWVHVWVGGGGCGHVHCQLMLSVRVWVVIWRGGGLWVVGCPLLVGMVWPAWRSMWLGAAACRRERRGRGCSGSC